MLFGLKENGKFGVIIKIRRENLPVCIQAGDFGKSPVAIDKMQFL